MELMEAELVRWADQKFLCRHQRHGEPAGRKCRGRSPKSIPESVSEFYDKDLNMTELLVQLQMLPRFLKAEQGSTEGSNVESSLSGPYVRNFVCHQ